MDSPGGLLSIITSLSALIVGTVTALWVYTKYVLERGILPAVKFYVTLKKIGRIGSHNVVDVKVHLHNIGSATLVARNIRLDLRYITQKSPETEVTLLRGDKAGRLAFPYSLIKKEGFDPSTLIPVKIRKDEEKLDQWLELKPRGFLLLQHDTFVQTGVDQSYTFVTRVPANTQCILAWSSFEYAQKPSPWQKRIASLSRQLGLIQYTLEHAIIPHTVEDVFWLGDKEQ